VPPDNPFVGQQGAAQEIWSWGHRNIEGGAIDPITGRLWTHEFGPWGGDELNVPEPGRNYGWPLVSWGRQYSGEPIPDPPTRPHLARSVFHWTPVISPSGIVFYEGEAIPAWKGAILIGGLSSNDLVRLVRRGEQIVGQERIDFGFRIRDVAQGPDGAVYLLSDQPKGEIFRVSLEETAGQRPLPDLSPD
jgi:glucose/arabinose dehydrogenase